MDIDLMQRLARRSPLASKFGLRFIDSAWPHLDIEDPAGVARLIGEAKHQAKPDQVFLRGQVWHHCAMLPSLFRNKVSHTEQLRAAEETFVGQIRKAIPAARFDREDLPALLQHYGFRTSWLDAVDNLFVAVWFATHELQTKPDSFVEIAPSAANHGWLYLIATTIHSRRLKHIDLRREHHPLSTRPHVQHGISLACLDSEEIDLRDFVVATVRVPNLRYTLHGRLFEASFLMPGIEADNTLRLLLKHRVDHIAARVEVQYRLPPGTLGRVSRLSASSTLQ